MRKILLVLALLTIAGGSVSAAELELTPFVGYRFGGDVPRESSEIFEVDVEVDEAAVYGMALDIKVGPGVLIELFVSRQETDFIDDAGLFQPDEIVLDVDVSYYHVGVGYGWRINDFEPFVLGSLGITKISPDAFGLHDEDEFSMSFGGGVKIWRVKPEKHQPGRVIHGSLLPDMFTQLEGMFLYDMKDNLVSFGYVTPLHSSNPYNDPHLNAQRFKTVPFMRDLLEGAELVRYGAKCIPSGALYAQPKLYTNGALLVGDSASMLDISKLSGVHMAMKSGMLAAETICQALAEDDFSTTTLGTYTERYRASWAYEEHRKGRNHTGSMEVSPLFLMAINSAPMMMTGGRGLVDELHTEPSHTGYKKLWELPVGRREPEDFEFDNVLTFSKEHLVSFSGTAHEADQPHHLRVADKNVCSTICARDYGNPCERFCPAAVYEMVDDPEKPGLKSLLIHHENCVHCKTCDIVDPYQIITWVPPEGGEGPDYNLM